MGLLSEHRRRPGARHTHLEDLSIGFASRSYSAIAVLGRRAFKTRLSLILKSSYSSHPSLIHFPSGQERSLLFSCLSKRGSASGDSENLRQPTTHSDTHGVNKLIIVWPVSNWQMVTSEFSLQVSRHSITVA